MVQISLTEESDPAHAVESVNEIDEILVSGDLAYCRTRLKVTVTPKHGGTPMLRSAHALSIMRRCEDGKWRLARDANMVMPDS